LSLKDRITRARIQSKIRRIESGNYGDHKRFQGILEIKLDFGKGYRLYCGESGNTLVVLLLGGDKSTQEKDIKKALEYWEDYHEQKKA
jgi:putative addiction module killer protein